MLIKIKQFEQPTAILSELSPNIILLVIALALKLLL
jgi:hypothetical protein